MKLAFAMLDDSSAFPRNGQVERCLMIETDIACAHIRIVLGRPLDMSYVVLSRLQISSSVCESHIES